MKNYIEKLNNKQNLSHQEMQEVMGQIMSARAPKEDVAEFLLALRAKGPTINEITGAAQLMRQFVVPVRSQYQTLLDTCGTGGDKKNTFNISTIVALVVAASGIAVAKHGNRSVSSHCGSADVLEALGVNLNLDEQFLGACLRSVGIAFLFAQKLHPAMKNVASIRRELKVETIFNILGPLSNPACATHQIMGVYSRDLVEPLAYVLKNLGLKRALVVHGFDGLDEITTTTKTFISEYNGAEILSYDISPQEVGIKQADPKDLEGGDIKRNAAIIKDILKGAEGAKRDIVLLNAAYAFYLTQSVNNIIEGIQLAQKIIDSGKAMKKLEELKEFSHSHATP